MPSPDWIGSPYVRVYLTLANDHPKVWRDPPLLGGWRRCRVAADRYWPAPAPLPPMPDETTEALADDGVLQLVDGEWFTFQGLSAQRQVEGTRGRIGGLARAAGAERIAGRFAG